MVQNQINGEESSLESLLARQRALTHETSFATVTMLLVASPQAAHKARHHAAGGFVGGLKAGWHGLVRVVSLVLTGAGAALPFAVIAAVLGYAAYRARRWYLQRRAAPGPASPPGPAAQP
jgi:predicted lipid-binding transport protein (Tim44 family)